MVTDILLVAGAVLILWKTADWFVEGAVGVAVLLNLPKMLIGLVLVSAATTAPELFTSLNAALHGYPELALGNAIGSVIVDASLAMGLAALLATTPLVVDPAIFKISARAVVLVLCIGFVLVMNGSLDRTEGFILLGCYTVYIMFLYRHYRQIHRQRKEDTLPALAPEVTKAGQIPLSRIAMLFGIGLTGVLLGSELLVRGATGIAETLQLSPVVIGLTITAAGTSMPEIATCVAAAMKRESDIGIGNIIGADILNVCWVAGASAIANPLTAEKSVLFFMFPSAIIIVGAMILMLRRGHSLNRWNGAVLVTLYCLYALCLFFFISPPSFL
ncbi:MAG: calcium/sodium antiporter [Candidatus Hydrogenedentes bacterium]|nr:calcium/sodium antiporter [Candidatus Hydrogenedentota bacterium]